MRRRCNYIMKFISYWGISKTHSESIRSLCACFVIPQLPNRAEHQSIAACCRYVQVIITAERTILPQNALGRPEHTEFVDRLLATIKDAHHARLRLEEQSGDEASLESGQFWRARSVARTFIQVLQ